MGHLLAKIGRTGTGLDLVIIKHIVDISQDVPVVGLESKPGNIHDLPFEDDEFDVVTCSETLEHVTDFRHATEELLRVAKKAVVITVPNDSIEVVEANIRRMDELDHTHINKFTMNTFDYLREDRFDWKILLLLGVFPHFQGRQILGRFE